MRLTKEGKRFLLALFLIALAALNTGNNLIYLILAMMLSISVTAALALALNLRGLSLSINIGQPVYAGQSATISMNLSNKKKFFPSYSLRVYFPLQVKGEGYFPLVRRSSSRSEDVTVFFEKRGRYVLEDFFVESSFPFIFMTKKTKITVMGECTVYPRLRDIEGLAGFSALGNKAYRARPGAGDRFLMLRDFRYGDDMRRISWKASAKADKLMVKEFGVEETRVFTVVLDNSESSSGASEEPFEQAVSISASVCHRLIGEGAFVRLITSEKIIPFGAGPEHLFKILDYLAVIKEEGSISEGAGGIDLSEGSFILIMKTEGAPLGAFSSQADMVVYADKL